jgi:hypothetical protein
VVHSRYLRLLAAGVLTWAALYVAFTSAINPYRVWPWRLEIERVNRFKPKRLDIDRLIKPYEVWRYQPRTVFLGTSRIHQSIDPLVLDGTRYAPAYNASVPAVSLSMNVEYLRHYVHLDPALRTVIIELFFYNFLGQGQERTNISPSDFVKNTATLFFSADALWASAQTVFYNLIRNVPAREIRPSGYHYYPPGHDFKGTFDAFPWGIWKQHAKRTGKLMLHEPAFDSLRELVKTASDRNVELIFILGPNHAYDDFYLDYIDAWEVMEQWLSRVSAFGKVYSFSQPNLLMQEPAKAEMRWWYDPYHFSLEMGRAMQLALTGARSPEWPSNFMILMAPENAPSHVAARRAAIKQWARENPQFVRHFLEEKRKSEEPPT